MTEWLSHCWKWLAGDEREQRLNQDLARFGEHVGFRSLSDVNWSTAGGGFKPGYSWGLGLPFEEHTLISLPQASNVQAVSIRTWNAQKWGNCKSRTYVLLCLNRGIECLPICWAVHSESNSRDWLFEYTTLCPPPNPSFSRRLISIIDGDIRTVRHRGINRDGIIPERLGLPAHDLDERTDNGSRPVCTDPLDMEDDNPWLEIQEKKQYRHRGGRKAQDSVMNDNADWFRGMRVHSSCILLNWSNKTAFRGMSLFRTRSILNLLLMDSWSCLGWHSCCHGRRRLLGSYLWNHTFFSFTDCRMLSLWIGRLRLRLSCRICKRGRIKHFRNEEIPKDRITPSVENDRVVSISVGLRSIAITLW